MNGIQLIAGSSHPVLAQKISKKLKIPLTPIVIKNFANGEIYVRVEKKVRGDDIFIIQTMGGGVNDTLMETLIMVDALKRSSAGRINLICPQLCYSRQDRRTRSHEPITSKLVANLLTKAGIDRLITVDLHAEQIQGFYDIPLDHLFGYPLIAKMILKEKYKDIVVVSPDIGGVKRANKLADLLGAPIAIIDKIRKEHNKCEVAHLVGDVKGKTAILIDDIIDTGGSICGAADTVKQFGAKEIIICATHALLNGEASKNLEKCSATKVMLLDSVPIPKEKRIKKMEIISLAILLSKIISRVHNEESLGELFKWEEQHKLL
ncbi:MAG: ribose-phosphate pyrophosphokinase [Candidatus Shapirobacteria bacterium]|nr:ribose-phosphate pyrophosphokinase [Candidatus Shapirobacteria bacterium]